MRDESFIVSGNPVGELIVSGIVGSQKAEAPSDNSLLKGTRS